MLPSAAAAGVSRGRLCLQKWRSKSDDKQQQHQTGKGAAHKKRGYYHITMPCDVGPTPADSQMFVTDL